MTNTITVAIPTIPPRRHLLERALRSVEAQTLQPDHVSVSVDHGGRGASWNRNEAWQAYDTEWVAFLDDDDELLPHHLEHLLAVAVDTGADLVYPWHRILDRHGRQKPDVLCHAHGVPFDPDRLFGGPHELIDADDFRSPHQTRQPENYIPVTVLCRRRFLVECGGFSTPPGESCEDWRMWRKMVKAGARFVHTPEVTWIWHHHGANTEGRGDRWGLNGPNTMEAPL